jgi:hypothetical protein
MTSPRHLSIVLIFVLCSAPFFGCAAVGELFRKPQDFVAPMVRPDRLYEELVDNYVEMCAVSQYRPVEGAKGGSPGHAVMYLKGACNDESSPYPRLRRCKYSTFDRADPEHGAGVSVNRWFKNVNWVATPGKALFYEGELTSYELLDAEKRDAAAQRAIDLGMYRGVELHPIRGEEEPRSLFDFVQTESLGTDFALRFGRSVFCTRLPMPPEMLTKAMDYLNSLNDEYWKGEAAYEWNGLGDNCVHTLHNALAAAGVWKPKSVQTAKLRQITHLAVPANTFVELAHLSNRFPIEDFEKVRGNEMYWKDLVEHDWVPAQAGALVKMLPVHQVNALYDTKYRMFVLGGFMSNQALKRAQRMLSDGRYLQLDANMRYFYDRYQHILEGKDARLAKLQYAPAEKRADAEIYYAYIEKRRDRLIEAVERLAKLDSQRQELLYEAAQKWRRTER